MTTKIAYLEISPRQTGKTTRLVKFACQLKDEGKTVIFVTPMAKDKHLRQQLPGVIVLADGQRPPVGVELTDAIWIYDEFDWLTSTQLRDGAYYATTAKRVRRLGVDTPDNDLLMQLLEVNGLHFQRHFWFFGLQADNWFSQAREFYSPDDYRLLILGEFLK
ncbi:hypothetical protein C4K14_1927 [Pseudomonas chlororaphis subsp. aureofaciens]|uniref:hypothetical protein n=1 Tax=Pseudomonas chlororaphis TaxID=587753 RepID=UPI000F55C29B|nr:hypothetical protein [Pseudomonas chlororaphis]AZD84761.1 hypothetical protein C4K14_1927 [Pseudomonas chlororaphis subsp. aureofaciens]